MVEHLLEQEQSSLVVASAHHHPVAEGLAERMGGHLDVQVKVVSDTLEDTVNGLDAERLIDVAAVVGFTTEHIVAEADIRSVLEVESDRLDDRIVDGDVAICLALTGITGLLLEHRETILKGAVIVDEVGEAEHTQVAHAESKVDADDEEHIVSVSTILNKVVRDGENVVHTLDGFSGVFRCELTVSIFCSRSDETCGELARVRALEHIHVNNIPSGVVGFNSHNTYPFICKSWSLSGRFTTFLSDLQPNRL